MRKLLLSASALAAMCLPAAGVAQGNAQAKAADEKPSMVWGYCEEPNYEWAGGLPSGLMGYSLIGFTDNLTKKFAGCEVESIIIAKGYFADENPKIDVIFATGTADNSQGYPSLKIDDVFIEMKDVSFAGDNYSWVEIPLEETWEIEEGVPFYVGWGYAQQNDEDLPLVGDMIANGNPDSSWMGGDVVGTPITSYLFWDNCNSAGANCVRLRITGDNLPTDDVSISSIEASRFVATGENAEVAVTVKNLASTTVSDLELSLAIPGGPKETRNVSGLSIPSGKQATVNVDDINIPFEGNLTLEIEILKVNGNADVDPSNNLASANILSLEEGNGFERNVVVEEGTGTWCGNCPRGIVGMRKMAEKYGEKFTGIAAHSGDEMQISSYAPFLNRYIDVVGYPYCTVDRVISCDPNFSELEGNYIKEAEVPAIVDVKITGTSLDGSNLTVNANAKFCLDEYFGEYGWAYVITEDNVGPYVQTNYFTTPGSLEGWDYTDPAVPMYYDEVAVAAYEIMGTQDSFPTVVMADDLYENSAVIDARKVKNWDNAHLTAMVINRKTGYVENSAHYSFNASGVESVNESASRISAANGSITLVSGDYAEVYSLSGVKIASLRNGQSVKTGSGIFMVKHDGSVEKLMVK